MSYIILLIIRFVFLIVGISIFSFLKYKIESNSISPKNVKIKLPPIIKENHKELNINKNIDNQYHNDINKFYRILKRRLPDECLNTFKNNIQTASIKRLWPIFCRSIGGLYIPKTNKIMIESKDFITHELLHLSSNCLNSIMNGFRQSSLKDMSVCVGTGLNEGYTDLLDERYFNQPPEYTIEYIHSILIEKIISKDKMEKYYFKGNLYEVKEELKKYSNEEDIIIFLRKLDYITANVDLKRKYNKCQKYITENILFLLKIMLLKFKNSKKYPLTDNHYNNMFNDILKVIKDLKNNYNCDEIDYSLLNLEDTSLLIDSILNTDNINNSYTNEFYSNKLTYKIKSR